MELIRSISSYEEVFMRPCGSMVDEVVYDFT
jgi:hypothetical protein